VPQPAVRLPRVVVEAGVENVDVHAPILPQRTFGWQGWRRWPLALALALAACGGGGDGPRDATTSTVDDLRVAPEGRRDGFDRDLFPHWVDADGDGCDTRDEVLLAESRTAPHVDPTRCLVVRGDWLSTYDGYSTPDPTELEVDHVVALAEAWDSGASAWDEDRRTAFANDLGEGGALQAVTAAMNQSKGDKDPAEWQPPNRDAWCGYAASWVRVKVRWDLTADEAEVRALRNMLDGC
jgi:hypothetical protein